MTGSGKEVSRLSNVIDNVSENDRDERKSMYKLFPDKDVKCTRISIPCRDGRHMPALVVAPGIPKKNAPGILWIHGGGYMTGMKEMVHMSRAIDLVKNYGATVISPGYRLSFRKPYPAAIEDCYDALLYLKNHADELEINRNQIMAGGESAGGGLCVALCMMARDTGAVNIAYQMPLYPMLDNFDTETSADNHGKVWNTRKNHIAWKLYLRKDARKKVSPYAAPARQTDYEDLPPAYSFVGDGEPFYAETCTYINNLKKAGIEAELDVYHSNMHAFDMMKPQLEISRQAALAFNRHFEYAMDYYFAENFLK